MTQPINRDQLYTYAEVRKLLGVSENWIYCRRKEGLPVIHVAGRVWIEGADLLNFMRSRKVTL